MTDPKPPEQAYDVTQPFLERVKAAVARAREGKSPHIEYHPDGSFTETVDRPKRRSLDTIGTKAALHWQARTFREGAQDAFAMNYNDLVRDRAVPFNVDDAILIECEDGDAIAETAESLGVLCTERGIQFGGGETAILNTMHGYELLVVADGAQVTDQPERWEPGDVLIGLPSNGLHSNGYTDARRLFADEIAAGVIRPEFTAPTRIYDELVPLLADPRFIA